MVETALVKIYDAPPAPTITKIGHFDLAHGAQIWCGMRLYISIAEAIYLESLGETVEIHFEYTEQDETDLARYRKREQHRWSNDRLPDGWTNARSLPEIPVATDKPKKVKKSESSYVRRSTKNST